MEITQVQVSWLCLGRPNEGVNNKNGPHMFSDTLWLLLPPHSPRSFSPPGRWEAPGRGCVPQTVCSIQIRALQQELQALSCSGWRGGGGAAVGLDLEGGVGTFKRPWWGNRRTRHRRWRQHIAADSPKQPWTVWKSKCLWNVFHKPSKKENPNRDTLLNLLLKTATNLSHSVLCQRVPNL